MPVGTMMSDSKAKASPEVTGSVIGTGRAAAITQAPLPAIAATGASAAPISQADWGYARGALGLALTSTQTGAPVPWANPETGSRGNFAPIAPASTDAGQTCRDFVATRLEKGEEVRLTGRACRTGEGQWDIAETTSTKAPTL
jgi:surface antigen